MNTKNFKSSKLPWSFASFWLSPLLWIFIRLLVNFVPISTYQNFVEQYWSPWWFLLLIPILVFLLWFPSTSIANKAPKWFIKLVDRRFAIEVLLTFYFLVFLFFSSLQYFPLDGQSSINSPLLALWFLIGTSILFLFFFSGVAFVVRIKRLLEKEKEKAKVSESVLPIYSSKRIKLSFSILIFVLVVLLILAPLLGFVYKKEIELRLGTQIFFSIVHTLQLLVIAFLGLSTAAPIANFLRSRKYKAKLPLLNLFLLFMLVFFSLSPISTPSLIIDFFRDLSPWFLLLFTAFWIVLFTFFLINLVVRYQELLDAERYFKTLQKS